jgi:mono/diheme cytochrome c family protein
MVLRAALKLVPLGFVLVALLVGCGSSSGPEPVKATGEVSMAEAKRAYTMKCSLCHGSDGRLGASQAPDLALSEMSLQERIAIITYGKGVMPPQKDVLDARTIEAVARYIENFRE